MKINWEKTIENIQQIMLGLVIGFTALSILAFIFFDAIAGTGIMYFLTRGNLVVSIGISLATSGLLNVLMIIVYMLNKEKNKDITKGFIVIVGLFYVIDIIFDSLTAEILAYNKVVSTKEMTVTWLHWMYRILLGGLSSFGDALGFATILGLTTLKDVFKDIVPKNHKVTPSKYRTPTNSHPPRKVIELDPTIASRIPKSKRDELDDESMSDWIGNTLTDLRHAKR